MNTEQQKAAEEITLHDATSEALADVPPPAWQAKERWTRKALDRNSRCDDAFWAWASPGQ